MLPADADDAAQGTRSDQSRSWVRAANCLPKTRANARSRRLFGVDEDLTAIRTLTVVPSAPTRGRRRRRPDGASSRPRDSCGGVIMLQDSDIGTIAAVGPLGHPPHSKYERLIARAKQVPAATTIVVHPCDETSLRGPIEAAESGHHHSNSGRPGRQDHRRGQAARHRHRPLSRLSTRRTARRRRRRPSS